MAIKLLFALDVEDWVHPEADDAVLRLCQIAQDLGITWGLFVVAEKARALLRRGRTDVIDAMARHELCYHLDAHGPFPEPVVLYSDYLPWDQAVAKALLVESRGLADVRQIFATSPVAWCQGEANWSPQLAVALSRLSVPLWNGAPVGENNTGPAWFCTSLVLRRAPHFVSVQPDPAQPNLFAAFKERFRRRAEEKSGDDFIIVFGHPTRWVFRDWFLVPELSLVRQALESRPTQIDYSRPPAYSPAEIDSWFEQTRRCLAWCLDQPFVEPYTYAQLAQDYSEPALRHVPTAELLAAIRPWVAERRYDWVRWRETTLSAADVFGALSWAIAHYAATSTLPDAIPLRRLLGPTYPYPEDLPSAVSIPADRFVELCCQAETTVNDTSAVPHAVRVGSQAVGAGPFLLSMVSAVEEIHRTGRLSGPVTIAPAPAYPSCVEMDCFQQMPFRSHSLPQAFTPERVRLLALMQSWSFRPAVANAH